MLELDRLRPGVWASEDPLYIVVPATVRGFGRARIVLEPSVDGGHWTACIDLLHDGIGRWLRNNRTHTKGTPADAVLDAEAEIARLNRYAMTTEAATAELASGRPVQVRHLIAASMHLATVAREVAVRTRTVDDAIWTAEGMIDLRPGGKIDVVARPCDSTARALILATLTP